MQDTHTSVSTNAYKQAIYSRCGIHTLINVDGCVTHTNVHSCHTNALMWIGVTHTVNVRTCVGMHAVHTHAHRHV